MAVEGQPVLQERELAAMEVAEAVAIAVVADPDADKAFVLGNFIADMRRAGKPEQLAARDTRLRLDEPGRGQILDAQGRMRGGGARHDIPIAGLIWRGAAIGDDRLQARAHLEGAAAGMGAVAQMDGRRAAGVGQHNGFAGSQPRIARLRRKHAGKDAAHVVIGKDGCHLIEQRRPHAVKMRDAAVPHPQKAQHRVHVVDRGVERIGRLKLARDEALLEGQQFQKQLDQVGRIA